jgi:AraC family transcriptional regulator
MNPKIITIAERKIIGLNSRMKHTEYANIVALWKRFMPNRKEIKSGVNDEYIAMQIYADFNNFEQSFDIWACIEVSSLEAIPEGMDGFIISEGEYAIFLQKGMDASSTYQRIVTEWLPQSGFEIDNRPHFQVMGKNYKNGSPDSEEDFYVPIKRKL